MAGLSYEFDRRPTTPQRRGGGKWLRLLVIFCVVAAVTGGVLLAIKPESAGSGKENAKEDKKTQLDKQSENGSDEKKTDEVSDNSKADDGEKVKELPENNKKDREKVETGVDDDGVVQIEGGKTLDEKADDPEKRVSDKGVVTENDPPRSADQPQYAPSRQSDLAEVMRKIDAAPAESAIAQAVGFLKKEQEFGGMFSENWLSAGKKLTDLRRNLWKNGEWKKSALNYKVRSGDMLGRISIRHNTTIDFIKLANKRKNNTVYIDERLLLLPGPWKIEISRRARLLNVWRKIRNQWQIFAVFRIGVGRSNKTPEGDFYISSRLRHPRWHGPEGRIFKYGEKGNPLGDYFLKLASSDKSKKKLQGYGIHGSADDSSVGRSLSNGCIRMRNRDVELLYYLLPAGTPVKIVD